MTKIFITIALSVIAILLYDRIKKLHKRNDAHKSHGGKGANQAAAAKSLFAYTAFCARCGADLDGDEYIKYLKSHKIDLTLVKRDKTAHTGVALITVDKRGENIISVAAGAYRRWILYIFPH